MKKANTWLPLGESGHLEVPQPGCWGLEFENFEEPLLPLLPRKSRRDRKKSPPYPKNPCPNHRYPCIRLFNIRRTLGVIKARVLVQPVPAFWVYKCVESHATTNRSRNGHRFPLGSSKGMPRDSNSFEKSTFSSFPAPCLCLLGDDMATTRSPNERCRVLR